MSSTEGDPVVSAMSAVSEEVADVIRRTKELRGQGRKGLGRWMFHYFGVLDKELGERKDWRAFTAAMVEAGLLKEGYKPKSAARAWGRVRKRVAREFSEKGDQRDLPFVVDPQLLRPAPRVRLVTEPAMATRPAQPAGDFGEEDQLVFRPAKKVRKPVGDQS